MVISGKNAEIKQKPPTTATEIINTFLRSNCILVNGKVKVSFFAVALINLSRAKTANKGIVNSAITSIIDTALNLL